MEIAIEQDREVRRILKLAGRANGVDLEAWETALRAAVLAAGARVLEELLHGCGFGRSEDAVICECGTRMQSRGHRHKQLLTILGPVAYQRTRYQCPKCLRTEYPSDGELDVEGTGRSPGLRRLMARAGSRTSFREAAEDLHLYAGITVSAKDVERVAESVGQQMEAWATKEREVILQEGFIPQERGAPILYICTDGTGIPMAKAALAGRRGKQPDGSARTREVKLGCVFTQNHCDDQGLPVRDLDSTSFVGAIERADIFGWRLYGEAVRRGLNQADKVVILGDGAQWIRSLAEEHFPGATQIIDLFHAREHISELCKLIAGSNEKALLRYRMRWWTNLDYGNLEKIVSEAEKLLPKDETLREQAEREIAYLKRNQERMRYNRFRSQGFFVGSGVIEAGCRALIGQRLKQSGMHWSLAGANAIISLRCIAHSGRFEDFWESQAS